MQQLEEEWSKQESDELLLKNQLKRLQEDLRRVNRAAERELKKKLGLEEKTGEEGIWLGPAGLVGEEEGVGVVEDQNTINPLLNMNGMGSSLDFALWLQPSTMGYIALEPLTHCDKTDPHLLMVQSIWRYLSPDGGARSKDTCKYKIKL